MDIALPLSVQGVPRDSRSVLINDHTEQITIAVGEIERLLGDTTERTGRWARPAPELEAHAVNPRHRA